MCILTLYCMKVINPIWNSGQKYLEKYSGLKFIHTNLFFFQPFHIYHFSMGFIIIYCYTGFTCNNDNNNNNNNNKYNNNNNNDDDDDDDDDDDNISIKNGDEYSTTILWIR